MFSKNLKIIIFALFCLIFILGPDFVLAQRLEIQYPPVPFPGVETPNQFMQKIHDEVPGYVPEQALPLYVKYFYYLLLTIVGLIAFGAIVYGGFQYLVSFGAPVKMIAAKEQIFGGILGLIILLSSYLILTTINPELAVFRIPGLEKITLPPIEIEPIESGIPVYFQIPTGTIIENAVINEIGRQKMAAVKTAAEETRAAAENLKNLTEDLKEETDKCKCDTSQCNGPGACTGTGCPDAFCDEVKINDIKNQITQAINQLITSQSGILVAQTTLLHDYFDLEKAGLLMSLEYEEVFTYNDLLSIKDYYEEVKIESFPGWENIDLEINGRIVKDPITFYLDKKRNEKAIELAELLPPVNPPGPCGPPGPPGPPGLPCTDCPPPPLNPGALSWPVSNPVVGQPFCQYCGGGWHGGIDINFDRPSTDPVFAAADGMVIRAGYLCADPFSHLGNHVSIEHEIQGKTYTTDYFHLSSIYVGRGNTVTQGQQIGTIGNTCTGSVHLHFALRQGSSYVNPCLFLPGPVPGIQCLTGEGCRLTPSSCSI